MVELGLSESEQQNAQRVVDRAIDRMASANKSLGQTSREELMDMREKMAKADDPETIKSMLDANETEVNNLLQNLQELPRDQYEKIKDKLEMPIKMMRQRMSQQQPPPPPPPPPGE